MQSLLRGGIEPERRGSVAQPPAYRVATSEVDDAGSQVFTANWDWWFGILETRVQVDPELGHVVFTVMGANGDVAGRTAVPVDQLTDAIVCAEIQSAKGLARPSQTESFTRSVSRAS